MNKAERNGAIRSLYVGGKTSTEIGVMFNVSRSRVQQILAKMGIGRVDGGIHKRMQLFGGFRDAYEAGIDQRCIAKFGMTIAEKRAIRREYGKTPLKAFATHKSNSKKRGISFLMNFRQWWDLWQASGRWEQRGKVDGKHLYVMARDGDCGPYEIGNVRITTQSDNMHEHQNVKRQKASLHMFA